MIGKVILKHIYKHVFRVLKLFCLILDSKLAKIARMSKTICYSIWVSLCAEFDADFEFTRRSLQIGFLSFYICDETFYVRLPALSSLNYCRSCASEEKEETVKQGVLPWLTNSALVYEPKCGGRVGFAGSQPIRTAVHWSPTKLWRHTCSSTYLTYADWLGHGDQ
jgi:hypothetical protein